MYLNLPFCTSTMDEAATLAKSGKAQHLDLITADVQTAARGRQGKSWYAFPGHSFAGTFIATQNLGPHLPLLISLALLKTCKGLEPQANLAIKWPNDVLKDGKKIAGILIEQPSPPASFALIGIGLNLTQPAEIPADFPGTFLSHNTAPEAFLDLIPQLTTCIRETLHLYNQQGWSAFAAEYQSFCATIGQNITWKPSPHGDPATEISGTVTGLDANGALKLKDATGMVRLIHAGEIIAQGRAV